MGSSGSSTGAARSESGHAGSGCRSLPGGVLVRGGVLESGGVLPSLPPPRVSEPEDGASMLSLERAELPSETVRVCTAARRAALGDASLA